MRTMHISLRAPGLFRSAPPSRSCYCFTRIAEMEAKVWVVTVEVPLLAHSAITICVSLFSGTSRVMLNGLIPDVATLTLSQPIPPSATVVPSRPVVAFLGW